MNTSFHSVHGVPFYFKTGPFTYVSVISPFPHFMAAAPFRDVSFLRRRAINTRLKYSFAVPILSVPVHSTIPSSQLNYVGRCYTLSGLLFFLKNDDKTIV